MICEDCGKSFHQLEGNRWCESCYDKGLCKDMSDHFDNYFKEEMKMTTEAKPREFWIPKAKQLDKMKPEALKEYLKELIEKLDELDDEDFFGTEGWRKYLMGED